MSKLKRYIWNNLLAIDQLANALLGGDPDETISSRAGKRLMENDRIAIVLCWFLDFFESDHCHKAIETDEGGDAVFRSLDAHG